ncbi:hypothetical protein [Xenorhabdus bharatensis]|uniref:hypothetical protein n=1 Tax=Xenorhabdus bharatensis TaxID=3136256 RepID=UPI0030F47513
MKIIDDICSSIAGNAKTRINDPFIGTFICTWVICNWNPLSLLFLGEKKITERINFFKEYLSGTPLLEWNYLLTIPLSITLFYLFIFPWISLKINAIQRLVNEKLHNQAIDIELNKTIEQKKIESRATKS